MYINAYRHPEAIYPYDEWKIVETSYREPHNLRNETIFALGNGYIGMRGNFEEGFQGPKGGSVNGTYLNGFFDSEPIHYPEGAHGFAKRSQTMLNVTDAKGVGVRLNGEPFSLYSGIVHRYERELDMRDGTLTRTVEWESPSGAHVMLVFRRFVSLTDKHLAVISVEVTPLNGDVSLVMDSSLNGEVMNEVAKDDPRVGAAMHEPALLVEDRGCGDTRGWIRHRTRNTGFRLLSAIDHQLQASASASVHATADEKRVGVRYEVTAARGETVILTKYAAYFTSKDYPVGELLLRADATLDEARRCGLEQLLNRQSEYLGAYWRRADVVIEGDDALQQGMRYNAFQLLQSVGRDGRTNIGAKGLTGEGYEGHYFWDTEMFMLPFFLYTSPEISRSLLLYRYHTLDQARARAGEMSQRGALYPWRTINGEETSAYYPAGTAQAHINADIAYAVKKYVEATGDEDFLRDYGAEMLFETARFWVDLGHFNPRRGGLFCIDGVTGPDEYTAVVNNNAYTNLMAKDHLAFACRTADWMREHGAVDFARLSERMGLAEGEISEWRLAADMMFIPSDEELGIIAQDDSFLSKEKWDFAGTPADQYPLLLHFHPLVIYRHQVLKQADVVLAMFLQSNRFSLADKVRNYYYYEALTTHDSSLSPCIHSIIAAEIGSREQAYDYFIRTVRMDLDDVNGNAADGLHTASMAGSRLSFVNGFAGMRDEGGWLRFNPILPKAWKSYRFKLVYQDRLLDIQVTPGKTIYELVEGEPLTIVHVHSEIRLEAGQPYVADTAPKLEAVIFDLDGVITNTAEYHYEAWKTLADELGVRFDRVVNERLKGVSRMESLDVILEQGAVSLGAEEKAELAARKNRLYGEMIEKITPGDLLPGIPELLRELRESGVRLALASASLNAPAILRKLQIEGMFEVVVDPGSLKKGKPDPEIFLEAAERLEVKPSHCIGIEDSESGIAAIRAAGMFAVGVGDAQQLGQADIVVPSTSPPTLAQLREWFGARVGV